MARSSKPILRRSVSWDLNVLKLKVAITLAQSGRSLARIHEHLYRSQDLAWVDMAEYIHGLGDFLRRSYGTHAIALKIDAPDVALDIDTAVPCGLIINELVSNAMKYAFPQGQTGEICIALHSVEDRFELVVSDDGVGLPADLDLENLQSLGLKVVSLLTGQLKGTLELDGSDGTIYKITFPEPTGMS
jgi:two-component sensor histidine kinase